MDSEIDHRWPRQGTLEMSEHHRCLGPMSVCPMQLVDLSEAGVSLSEAGLGLSEASVGLFEAPFGARAQWCFAVVVAQVSKNTASGKRCATRRRRWMPDHQRSRQNTLDMTKHCRCSCWACSRQVSASPREVSNCPGQVSACLRHPFGPQLSCFSQVQWRTVAGLIRGRCRLVRGRLRASPRQLSACPRHPWGQSSIVFRSYSGPGFAEHRLGGTMHH
jgi:hypothetical protein